MSASASLDDILAEAFSEIAKLEPPATDIDEQEFAAQTSISCSNCEVVTLAPKAFAEIRRRFGVDENEYFASLSNSDYAHLGKPGKSGSALYVTQDRKFFVKLLRKRESKFFMSILKSYFEHVTSSAETTLLTRMYTLIEILPNPTSQKNSVVACCRQKPKKQKWIHAMVMENVFPPDVSISQKFDLKGSKVARSTPNLTAHQQSVEFSGILKDMDLNRKFVIGEQARNDLIDRIRKDCALLERLGIMDYSLLIGVSREQIEGQDLPEIIPPPSPLGGGSSPNDTQPLIGDSDAPSLDIGQVDVMGIPQTRSFGQKLLVLDTFKTDDVMYREILYVGLIDILQPYTVQKVMAHHLKGIVWKKVELSTVEPKFYSSRFQSFIASIFS